MNRLTRSRRPIEDKNYNVRKSREQDWANAIQNSINKLGLIEDLMEEYNINSVEELKEIIIKGLAITQFLESEWKVVKK